MADERFGLSASVQKSEDKDESGENLMLIIFKPEKKVDKDMKFEEYSYLYKGETENVVISHVVNFDENKTLYEEEGKTTYAIILNTHIYVNKEDVKHCFEVYAKAMKNIDN